MYFSFSFPIIKFCVIIMRTLFGDDFVIKNIMIDNQVYDLELKNGKKGSTGKCFRLQKGDVDLAVKIYFSKRKLDVVYPELKELKYFTTYSKETYPIILSHYPVFDLNEKYIGCAAPFLEETAGNTSDVLYTLPRKQIIEGFSKLQDSVSIINKHYIALCDWGIHNLVIGKGKDLPFGVYMIDDSSYCLDNEVEKYNFLEMNMLISDMIDVYFNRLGFNIFGEYEKEYVSRFSHIQDPVALLEKESEGYSCIGEFLKDFKNVYQKRKYYV